MEKSIDDIEFRKLVLKMHDEGYLDEEISAFFNVNKTSVRDIIYTFNVLCIDDTLKRGRFTKEENEIVSKNLDKDINFFIKTLKRQYYCLRDKIKRERKKIEKEKYEKKIEQSIIAKKITDEEIDFIKESIVNGDSINDISIALGRSEHSIRTICSRNKIKIKRTNGYTKEEDAFIRKAVKDGLTHKEIGAQISRSENGINYYCRKNKIKKESEVLPSGLKRCPICMEVKPTSCFYNSKYSNDGKRSWCKECEKKKVKEYKESKKNGK